jgi:hypothetical protein
VILAGASPVRAATLEPGDEVFVSRRVGFQVVSEVMSYDDGSTVTVWYMKRGEIAYSRGIETSHGRIVERCLIPLEPDDLLVARRGRPSAAALMRGEMLEQQEKRSLAADRRWARA